MNIKKFFLSILMVTYLSVNLPSFASITSETKYPDFSYLYNGEDKFEKINRRMFNLNLKMNKYALKPIHIIWASIMPKYGMERIQYAYTNLQYPKRLVSNILQGNIKLCKNETLRFLTNSTIGLGGMFDPAEGIFHIEAQEKGMEEVLTKHNIKKGPYLVVPYISSTTPRGIAGTLLDNALNPSNYIGSPVLAFIKLGFTVNNTYFLQPISQMIELTYADPYDITKKLYGIERYIKDMNLNRKEILETSIQLATRQEDIEPPVNNDSKTNEEDGISNRKEIEDNGIKNIPNFKDPYTIKDPPNKRVNFETSLKTNINLDNYYPQNPITDAMRTALFGIQDSDKSIWSSYSVWNRSFCNRIKTSAINIDKTKDNYKYKYILQKDKNAPLAIIYPSIGEGIHSHHSIMLAKIFYDEGYSVIIQGSQFHWEFIKSMPEHYYPGLPQKDAELVRIVTKKILSQLEEKYDCKFKEKTIIGTSLGALTALFVGNQEAVANTLDISNYISINPPIELTYAMKQIDKNTEEWTKNPEQLKEQVAITASKIIQILKLKNKGTTPSEILPFTEDEAKLITGFVLHQKLSDLIFALEEKSNCSKCEIYNEINNINFNKYAEKYLTTKTPTAIKDLAYYTSLYSISDYLINYNNYKIYHTLDDYLVNNIQLKKIKEYAGKKLVLLNNGSHLGYLYRPEFLKDLKQEITKNKQIIAHK